MLMGFFVMVLMAAAGFIVFMATHGEHDTVASIEHEVWIIRRQAARGWNTRRIVRHHRSFCPCQVEYLRRARRIYS